MIDPTALRIYIYETTIGEGVPPSSDQIAARFRVATADARQALAAMRIGKTVLVHPTTGEIWMAGPFSSVPTAYEASLGSVRWWGNCIWDLLGIAALVEQPVHLRASCIDCGEPFAMAVDAKAEVNSDWIAHFLLPARQWYEDVGFT